MDLTRFADLDIILVCGLPGAGKSHFAKQYFAGGAWNRVNRKELRSLLHEMTSFGDEWKEEYYDTHDENLVKYVERRICEHMLEHGRKLIIDNTSVTASSRKTYTSIAERTKKTIGALFINTPLKDCLERNRSRDIDAVPDIVITNLYAAIEHPEEREGFRRTLIIDY